MDIQSVNRTLVKAIESMHSSELAMLWEFTVPTPHEMHRKHGMALPKGTLVVPSPEKFAKPKKKRKAKAPAEPPREVSQDEARAGAVKDQAGLAKIFDALKPKQSIWVSYKSFVMRQMSSPPIKGFFEFRVGRRTQSKKHGTKSITLLKPDQKKPLGPGWQIRLHKSRDGKISLAEGDLATMNLKIYARPGG